MNIRQRRKMFLVTQVGAILGSLLIFNGASQAQDCLFADNFNDNDPEPNWVEVDSNSNRFRARERNNRVECWAPNNNNGGNFISGFLSSGWQIDLTADWALSAQYHINPPSPTNGDMGIAFLLAFDIDLDQDLITGYSLSGGIANYGSGDIDYFADNFWTNGVPTRMSELTRLYSDGTIYIWYDSSSGCISHGDTLFIPNMTVCGVNNLSNQTTALIGLGGYTFGNVPSSNGNRLWADDVCLLYGEIVGPNTGACCLGDSCHQTLEISCEGTWLGEGTYCSSSSTSCNSCIGDLNNDGQIDGSDLTFILGFWGPCTNPEDCIGDVTGDGHIDGADLTTVLAYWGPCK